jgi:hypothetical protein
MRYIDRAAGPLAGTVAGVGNVWNRNDAFAVAPQ